MTRPWRFVTASHRTRKGYGLVWLCALSCGHEQWRACKAQKTEPVKLVCWTCEREEAEAMRPEWMRGAA